MSHIAMVSIPAPGHVNPSLEVIRELVARGHRVTYANDPSQAAVIASVGAEPVPYDSTLPAHDDPARWPPPDDLAGQLSLFLDDAIAMLPQLALIPAAMQPNADRVDPGRYTFIGPCLGPRADRGTWERPDAGKILLISLGSAFTDRPAFYRECLTAFGDLPGWHVVLQIGKHVDEADLGPIPAGVEVHRWVPQAAILEQADAFVTHAGSGGINEALTCGVPMIAVPQAVDQFMNADILVGIGAGRRLDTEDATAEALRSTLLDLTADEETRARLNAIRAELQAAGTPKAADLIEALLP